jgi:hypothetical protein
MPTCTVARKRSGALRSARTVRAPARRSSSSWLSRVLRSDRIAISAPEKTALARISARMTMSSVMVASSRAQLSRKAGGARRGAQRPVTRAMNTAYSLSSTSIVHSA